MLNSEEKQYPPLALIKTWVWMMVESNVPEINEKGRQNIIDSFGSLSKANEYLTEKLQG
ncbi:hypothetical protein L2734_04475 [Parashewanella spongiae]|uniref:hypothetical protein n=1 Tax=Parashewanella spongiae TaxID=342950 RepID=UPI00140494EE|nr:hypothetical protein [Parashewanella spongiae]MCL1077435.1 hypothetical protein [Parashewanella spongiae]